MSLKIKWVSALLEEKNQESAEAIIKLVHDSESPEKEQLINFIAEKEKAENNFFVHFLACLGEANLLKTLLEKGVPYARLNNSGYTPLHYAVLKQKVNVVEVLLNNKTLIYNYLPLTAMKNDDGLSPLEIAQQNKPSAELNQILMLMKNYLKALEMKKYF